MSHRCDDKYLLESINLYQVIQRAGFITTPLNQPEDGVQFWRQTSASQSGAAMKLEMKHFKLDVYFNQHEFLVSILRLSSYKSTVFIFLHFSL